LSEAFHSNPEFFFYGSGYFESQFGIEWSRIEKGSPFPPLVIRIKNCSRPEKINS
jgi:hypothetical protein